MSTPEELRKILLSKAEPFIDDYIKAALGTADLKGSGIARAAIWDLLADIIKQAGDKTPLNINGEDAAAQIDNLLNKVAAGEISPEQGKKYMSLIQAGFEITELPKLIEALNTAEEKTK